MPARGGRGASKRGPEHWEDREEVPSGQATPAETKKPPPPFPSRSLRVPRPIDATELAAVKSYLQIRDLAHNGPYYAELQTSSLTDDKGRVHKRAGFDPFNDQDKYTARYQWKRRTVPDLTTRNYVLRTFPQELWSTLDPKMKNPIWKTVDNPMLLDAPQRSLKRKRDKLAVGGDDNDDNDAEARDRTAGSDVEDGNDTDASDPLLSGARRSRNATKAAKGRRADATKKAGEKSGFDAEDDFPDEDGRENEDGEDDAQGEEEPIDSEFEESDDGGGDDYNAEQYFDTGENDDDDYGGGDDDGGTY